ncbi:hypothetical protein LIER_24840 [Lithospermum erythrorhizon]|uniref:Uncharacterized protein n=1 Tax=Lithospermum erythrorhizon TaxID=34254 RepID=A0AAV3R5X1_LITER
MDQVDLNLKLEQRRSFDDPVITMVNSAIFVAICGFFPMVIMWFSTPTGLTASPVNPTKGVATGRIYARLIPNFSYVSRNRISTKLPRSTNIRPTSKFVITGFITSGSS